MRNFRIIFIWIGTIQKNFQICINVRLIEIYLTNESSYEKMFPDNTFFLKVKQNPQKNTYEWVHSTLLITSFFRYIFHGFYFSKLLIFSSTKISWLSDLFWRLYRSSHRRCSLKEGVIKNFAQFTGKHLCKRFFKSLWHRCFPVNFAKFLRTPFLQNTSRRLLFCLQTLSWNYNTNLTSITL